MRLVVRGQELPFEKLHVAQVALESLLLAAMRPPMPSQIRGVHVAFVTMRTLERSLLGVRPHVTIQTRHVRKRLWAHLALEWPHPGVRSDVKFQVLFSCESFATVIALKLFVVAVRSSMGDDRLVVWTDSPANVARHSVLVQAGMLLAQVPSKPTLGRE